MTEASHPLPHADLVDYMAGTLGSDAQRAFETHLESCSACRDGADDLGPIVELIAAAGPSVEVPHGLRDRTLRAVAASADEPEPLEERGVVAITSARARSRPNPALLGLAAAAVIVVVALLATGLLLRSDERPAAAEIALVDPDGGDAHGIALVRDTDEGRAVELDIEGLAPSPPGTYYECWFVGEGDSVDDPNRVSVGTFTVGADGTAHVRMTSAADPDRFPKMGVTLEPDDGNPKRTGDKVLVSGP